MLIEVFGVIFRYNSPYFCYYPKWYFSISGN